MGVLLAWSTAIGLQIVRDVRVEHRPPVPSEFVASGAVFGALALLSAAEPGLAGVLAWGFLIALALQAGGPQALIGGKPAQQGPVGSQALQSGGGATRRVQ